MCSCTSMCILWLGILGQPSEAEHLPYCHFYQVLSICSEGCDEVCIYHMVIDTEFLNRTEEL